MSNVHERITNARPNGDTRLNERVRMYGRLAQLQSMLLESTFNLDDDYVDPLDAFWDDDSGEFWLPPGGARGQSAIDFGLMGEPQLDAIRDECRRLARLNPFAINGHENRINYLVGSGHTYTFTAKQGTPLAAEIRDAERAERKTRKGGGTIEETPDPLEPVQQVWEEFAASSRWYARQQEIVRRRDRDGECFLRFFTGSDGTLRIRFVEPAQVNTPAEHVNDKRQSWGIVTDPEDVETVEGYWIDGKLVDAADIQHRKLGADFNQKRGLPLFYPVRKNLSRAAKLLRNMTVVSEIQTSIALIRKHTYAVKGALEDALSSNADVSVTSARTAKTIYHKHYAPGTILDAHADTEYDFPASGLNAANYVAVLQAELRAISSRLVMPEFMLSSDASNANYASTMVAEGPAVKMFQRLQWGLIEDDLDVVDRVLDAAVATGRLDAELRGQIEVTAEPPQLTTRNRKEDIEGDASLVDRGIMSKRTARSRQDLDPDLEEELIENEKGPDPFEGMRFGGRGEGRGARGEGEEEKQDPFQRKGEEGGEEKGNDDSPGNP